MIIDTTEYDRIIVKFLKLKLKPDWDNHCENPLRQDKSFEQIAFSYNYNWLMFLVCEIEKIKIDCNSIILESIGNNAKFIFDDGCRFLKDNKGETKREAIYKACVEFIKWYNEQKNK